MKSSSLPADVCKALGLGDTSKAVSRLDDDEKGRCSIPTPGGEQEMSVVSEPGLYSLVLGSRKPEAKAFKRWVTHDVIPAIRKHGMYATPQAIEQMLSDPDAMIATVTAGFSPQMYTSVLPFLDIPSVTHLYQSFPYPRIESGSEGPLRSVGMVLSALVQVDEVAAQELIPRFVGNYQKLGRLPIGLFRLLSLPAFSHPTMSGRPCQRSLAESHKSAPVPIFCVVYSFSRPGML